MSSISREIVIVGGGHAGLFAALALSDAGFADILVVDPQGPAPQPPSGRSLALLAGSRAIAERWGIWKHLRDAASPVQRVDVRDTGGGGHVVYDAEEIGAEALAWGFAGEELRLRLACAWDMRAGGQGWQVSSLIAYRGGRRPVLELADGTVIAADLVIAADGRGSRLRQAAGIATDRWTYDQAALSFILRHTRDSRRTVLERLRPAGPLATLPLGTHRCGITWVERQAAAQALMNRGEAGILAELGTQLEGALGDMTLDGPIQLYPLSAQHASRYARPCLALIGDAAHGVHPIHAQGFNMGIADVGVLAEELARARERGQAIGGEALRRYELRRRADNAGRLRMTDALNRLFSNDLLPLRPARRLLLDALSTVPPLRRRAIRHGMQLVS